DGDQEDGSRCQEAAMELRSEAFDAQSTIPTKYTCDGEDVSPPLFWSKGPEDTKSYLVLCEDPDAPTGTFHHWGIYNIPADETSLMENIPPRTEDGNLKQAENDFNNIGWGGPCPPRGHRAHRYHFKVWALKVANLEFDHTPSIPELKEMARPHLADRAELVALYERS
ncbi:MAG: YbhB/YbcL family Raf kinase inhibitor-like protein, partial [Persicimonas sp.]